MENDTEESSFTTLHSETEEVKCEPVALVTLALTAIAAYPAAKDIVNDIRKIEIK